MKIICPDCGKVIEVHGLGRKRLELPVKNIYDSLALGKGIPAIASELGCSRGYIYSILAKKKELKPSNKKNSDLVNLF
jgi:hypothetical protein